MSTPSAVHAGPRYAVLANRDTGDVKTFPTDEALVRVASGAWVLVCRETEHTPERSESEREELAGIRRVDFRVHCLKTHSGSCPSSSYIDAPAPEDWDARDLAIVEEIAADIMTTDCLMWTVRYSDRGKVKRTEITIEPGRKNARAAEQILGFHQVELSVDGHLSAFALAWLLRQSRRMEVSLLTDVDVKSTEDTGDWRQPSSAVEKLPKVIVHKKGADA